MPKFPFVESIIIPNLGLSANFLEDVGKPNGQYVGVGFTMCVATTVVYEDRERKESVQPEVPLRYRLAEINQLCLSRPSIV
jgi:hypothetical protein